MAQQRVCCIPVTLERKSFRPPTPILTTADSPCGLIPTPRWKEGPTGHTRQVLHHVKGESVGSSTNKKQQEYTQWQMAPTKGTRHKIGKKTCCWKSRGPEGDFWRASNVWSVLALGAGYTVYTVHASPPNCTCMKVYLDIYGKFQWKVF